MDNRSNAMMGFRRHIKAWSWLTLMSFVGQLSVATAGSIVADSSAPGNQRPTVTQTANGVPQVNIQTPSAAGVSRNSYQQFDVTSQGAILNNAQTNTQTELGGWIQANPALAGGSARIILNEVNSANPSLLNGAIEVGGSQAQVVIANPAGVTCDGCGFINADRATLTTGKAIINGGNLDGYLVERGSVKIRGAGLDSSQTDYTDIIARSIEVNAGIWANNLKVTAGANRVSTDHNSITPITGTGDAPGVAIDVGRLGGMYAGKIHLIGTEQGVGVNNAGVLGASSGQFIVTAEGIIQNSGQISGQGTVSLSSQSDVTNTGSMASKTAITVNAQGDINNTDTILSQGDVTLNAAGSTSRIVSSQNSILAAGIDDNGNLGTQGKLELNATQNISVQGENRAATTLTAQAKALNLEGSETSAKTIVLTASNGDLTATQASITATESLQASSSQQLVMDKAIVSAKKLSLIANSLSNSEGTVSQTGSDAMTLNLAGNLNNDQGTIETNSDNLTLSAANISNTDGTIAHAGLGRLTLTSDDIDNTTGAIQSNGDINLDVDTLTNVSGLIRSAQTATLIATSINNSNSNGAEQGIEGHNVILDSDLLNNTQGAVRADVSVTVLNSGTLTNSQGFISAGNLLDIRDRLASSSSNSASKTLSITNTGGSLIADSELIIDSKSLTGDGKVISAGDLTTKIWDSYTHTGEWQADNNATFVTAGTLNNHAELSAGNLLDITAATLDNKSTGDITAATTMLTATSPDTLINRGLIDGSQTYLNAITLNNLGTGRIYGDHIAIEATTLNNKAEGGNAPVIAARSQLDIGVSTLSNNEHALLFSADALSIGGSLDADHFATGQAVSVTNSSATIEALGNLKIAAATLNNTNAHFSTTQVLTTTNFSEVDMGQDCSRQYAMPGCRGNWLEDTTNHDYTKKVYTPVVSESDLANILAGGSMTLYGANLINDKSQIIAGGVLQGDLANITNIAAEGTQTSELRDSYRIHENTSSGYTWRGPFVRNVPLASITVDLAVTKTEGSATVSGTGTTVDSRAVVSVGQQSEATGSDLANISTLTPNLSLPNNSLFQILAAPTNRYLVETDPQFTSYRTWLSSNFMLTQMALDPSTTLKRLGDGFYEQRLLREQISQLTGRRFLEGYSSDESQYQALMEDGASFAQDYQLKLGVALTAAQIAQLTSDIVWLVEQSVTLADGSVQQVLVPQVYLKPRTGDLHDDGTLIAAEEIKLNLSGDLNNSGTIAGRTITQITAENIDNVGGYIVADVTELNAQQDINNIGGVITGKDSLSLNAGRDITIKTTTITTEKLTDESEFKRTNIDRIAGLYVTNPNGILLASAGNKLTLTAAEVINQGEAGQINLSAANDLIINTLTESNFNSATWDSQNHANNAASKEIGSSIEGQGDIQLSANNDVSLRAAKVSSEQGVLSINAGNNLTIEAGQATKNENISLRNNKRSYQRQLDATTHIASTLSGNDIQLTAGKDLSILGSQVEADNNLALAAKGDVRVESVQDTTYSDENLSKKSGFLGMKKSGQSHLSTTEENLDSNLTAGNDALVLAGDDITLRSSTISAGNDATIQAGLESDNGSISLISETDKRYSKDTRYKKSIGLSFSSDSISIASTKKRGQEGLDYTSSASQIQAGGDTNLTATEDINIIGSGVASGDDLTLVADRNVNIAASAEWHDSKNWKSEKRTGISWSSDDNGVSFFAGSEKNKQTVEDRAQLTAASQLIAGNDIKVKAGKNVNQLGSDITAGRDIDFTAANDISIVADINKFTYIESEESTRTGISVSVQHNFGKTKDAFSNIGKGEDGVSKVSNTLRAIDAVSQFAAGPTASSSFGTSRNSSTITTMNGYAQGSQFNAGRDISITAGGDTLLQGANIQAEYDALISGDNVTIEAANDTYSRGTELTNSWTGIRQRGRSVGFGESGSTDTVDINMNAGANNAITAGHDVMIDARNDMVIANSNIDAGRNIDLNAEKNLTITTDQGAYSEVHDGQSLGGEVGITVFENGGTIGFYGEVSGGQNDLKRLENNYQNSRLNAGDTLSIRTGKDTTIAGANLTADHIKADVGGDLWVSSKQDTGEVSGRKWDGSLRVTVGAGVSVSGSAGYGETGGEKNWVSEQTSLIGRKSVTINTENHTQLDGALIANITEDGKDGGKLTLNTGTFAYSDIQDKHTETSNYTRISGSWESENSAQDRGSNSGYTQTTGQNRGSEIGSSLDDRTTAGIEGSYSSLDREQINRATVGAGTITIKSNPEQDISGLNRDINTAQQLTKDKESQTELYVTETAVEDLSNIFTPDVEDDPNTPEDETQVNTLTKWADGLDNYGKNTTRQFIQMGNLAKDLSDSENAAAQLMGAVTQAMNDTLDKIGFATLGLMPGVENHGGLTTQLPALVFGDQINSVAEVQLAIEVDPETGKEHYVIDKFDLLEEDIDIENLPDDIRYAFVNGIQNSIKEAARNGAMQTGTDKILIAYNPEHGFLSDLIESGWDETMGKLYPSGNARQLAEMFEYIAKNDIPMNTAAHSQGGLLVTTALNWLEKGILNRTDEDDNPKYQFQLNGAPVPVEQFIAIAKDAGADHIGEEDFNINKGDLVPKVLGMNAENAADFLDAVSNIFNLFDSKISPHSSYLCQGDFCDDKQPGIGVHP